MIGAQIHKSTWMLSNLEWLLQGPPTSSDAELLDYTEEGCPKMVQLITIKVHQQILKLPI